MVRGMQEAWVLDSAPGAWYAARSDGRSVAVRGALTHWGIKPSAVSEGSVCRAACG
jgi:hypothetical protein